MKPPIDFKQIKSKKNKEESPITRGFFLNTIEVDKNIDEKIYNETIINLFKKQLTWDEVKELELKDMFLLSQKLENNLKLEKSNISVSKLSDLIQRSRSGFGFCVMTEFECKLCGQKEMWGSSNTPGICKKCSEKMAEYIAICYDQILKDK